MKIKDKNEAPKTEAAYPAYDLAEGVKVAEAVRDLGGSNAPVPRSLLAQHLKYAENGPSFFQRVSASKAFGLIDGRGSYSLTESAKQYFFPSVENGKQAAAVKMLSFPKAFAALVQKFDGGKLPTIEMIGNIIHTEADIPLSKKNILAGCFMRSAQFIGVIDTNGFLRCKAFVAAGNRGTNPSPITPDEKLKEAIDRGEVPKEFSINVKNSLFLNKERDREVSLDCPFSITRAEYDRVCNWIKATWIIEEENKNE